MFYIHSQTVNYFVTNTLDGTIYVASSAVPKQSFYGERRVKIRIALFALLFLPLPFLSPSLSAQMVWPPGGSGIPNYSGSSKWNTSYGPTHQIPNTFIPFATPGDIGVTTPGAGQFNALTNHGASGLSGNEYLGLGAGGSSSATGGLNSAVGDYSLNGLTTGTQNTAVGHVAAYSLTTGGQNVAIGDTAMLNNGTGNSNTAVGWGAMGGCETIPCMNAAFPASSENTAIGWEAMYLLTTGVQNTAVGQNSMSHLTTGRYNTTIGADSQSGNATGWFNTSYGHDAMFGSTPGIGAAASCASGSFIPYTASYNTALGEGSYCTATTGQFNTIVGWQAGVGLSSGSGNTYLGTQAGTINTVSSTNGSGNNNTFIGYQAGAISATSVAYSNSIALGYHAIVTASNQMVLGNPGVNQVVVPAGVSITSQDTGAPSITFGSNNVSLTLGGVSGTPSAVVASVPSNTFTSASTQPLTSFYTTTAAGQYQLCAQLSVAAAGTGTGTFADVMAYTSDGNIIDIGLGSEVLVASTGASNAGISVNNVPNCITAYLDNSTTVSWEIMAGGTIIIPPTMRYGFKVTYLGQ